MRIEIQEKINFIIKLGLLVNCEFELLDYKYSKLDNINYNNFILIFNFGDNNYKYSITKKLNNLNKPDKPIKDNDYGYKYDGINFDDPFDFKYFEIIYKKKEYYIVNSLYYLDYILRYNDDIIVDNFYFNYMKLDLDIDNLEDFQNDFFSYFIKLCFFNENLYKNI